MWLPRLNRCDWALLIIGLVLFILSIIIIAGFPSLYATIVKHTLTLRQYEDYSLSFGTFVFANPAMTNVMNFYFFNVTNPDEVMYYGAKPQLVEVGPFAVQESEHKKYIKTNEDGTAMFYENYKMYNIRQDLSCDVCNWDGNLIFPNPTGVGTAHLLIEPQYRVTRVGKFIISLGILLLGQYTFVSHPIREFLFDGYDDSLLSFAHSNLVYDISGLLLGNRSVIPLPVPAMAKFAFFYQYNNTQDENYWVRTGKDDINRVGEIITWADHTELPATWWDGSYARSIRGSDTGTFAQMHLDESSKIPMFQSFLCRSFTASYYGRATIHGIPSYTFTVPAEEYDTTLELNEGFRYKNIEHRNYYPDWPNCPSYNSSHCLVETQVNCDLPQNYCNDCCNGSYIDGNYRLPPGILPMACYPGRYETIPFETFVSAPHFAYSPPEMVNSVRGLQPDLSRHIPLIYNHIPYSGSIIDVYFRMQANFPVLTIPEVWHFANQPNKIIPMFWEDAHVEFSPHLLTYMQIAFVVVPILVTVVQWTMFGVSIIILAVFGLRIYLKYRKMKAMEHPKWMSEVSRD